MKVYGDIGSCEAGKFTARPRKKSKRDDRAIAEIVKADRFKTVLPFLVNSML